MLPQSLVPSPQSPVPSPQSLVIDPVRARAHKPCPENRKPCGAENESHPLDPPGVRATAEFDPRRRNRERETDDDRECAPPDQPKQQAARATESHREIA